MSETLPGSGAVLRETIRNWPKAPSEQQPRDLRRTVLDEWLKQFSRDWFNGIDSCPFVPYWPDDKTPDGPAIIERLGPQSILTLLDGSLLIGAYMPIPLNEIYHSPHTFTTDILKGLIDPRHPADCTPFSQVTSDEETPDPSWLWTRKEIEDYALIKWEGYAFKHTTEEHERRHRAFLDSPILTAPQPPTGNCKTWPYKHDTKLLEMIRWVIETYWEGRDPESVFITKAVMIEKLKEQFPGVSNNEAAAVDLVTRHDMLRNRGY